MPVYRIFRLHDAQVEGFRERAPKPGRPEVHLRHYEPAGTVEAASPYEAWKLLSEGADGGEGVRPLGVGDVLQENGEAAPPLLCNWWGFDEASWSENDRAPHPFARAETSAAPGASPA
jgi:hypothetical protein